MSEPGRERRFRFRLRTLLIAVAVVSIALAWLANALDWTSKRRAFAYRLTHDGIFVGPIVRTGYVRAPAGLWLLGEDGADAVWCDPKDVPTAHSLFPEANVQPLDKEHMILLQSQPDRRSSSGS